MRKYSEAEALYKAVLLGDPDDLTAQLGLIEISAWKGETTKAVEAARLLEARAPDASVRSFLGDLYLREWRLRDAAAQYEAALGVQPDHPAAAVGRRAVAALRGPRFEPRAFWFDDSGNFEQTMAGLAGTIPLADRASVAVRFEQWRFRAGETLEFARRDVDAVVTYHWNGALETRGGVSFFAHDDAETTVSPAASMKWSVTPRASIYLSGSMRTPVTDSILTVGQTLVQDVVGAGLDAEIARSLSLQLSFTRAAYSDDNVRLGLGPQISYRLPGALRATTRAQYQFHGFSDTRADYFSPSRFQILRAIVEAEPRLGGGISATLKGELPFVITKRESGFGVTAGLRFGDRSRASGEFVVFRHRVPGGAEAWSGHGLRATMAIGIGGASTSR
jgi:hypothetical protein